MKVQSTKSRLCLLCLSNPSWACPTLLESFMTPAPKHSRDCPNAGSSLGCLLDKGIFWEFSEGVRASPTPCPPFPSLQGFWSCWRDGTSSNGDDPWQIAVSSSLLFLNEQETPPAPHPASTPLPAPQIPGEWAEFGELGCPWRRRTRSQSSSCSWDGGDAVLWDITTWRGTLGTSSVEKKKKNLPKKLIAINGEKTGPEEWNAGSGHVQLLKGWIHIAHEERCHPQSSQPTLNGSNSPHSPKNSNLTHILSLLALPFV